MKPLYLPLLIGMNLLWSGSYSIFKILGEHLNAGSIATLRFGLASLLLLAVWPWLPGQGPKGRDLARATVMGVIVFCVAPRLQIAGVHRGHAGDTSLLLALDPLIIAVSAAMFLREHITARRWWGFALGMGGVALLSDVWHGARPLQGLLANLIVIVSFVCETAYSVLGKPLLARVGALKLVATGATAGAVANVLLDLATGNTATFTAPWSLPAREWLLIFYLVLVCTLLGYTLWYVVIRETDVSVTGMTVFVQPISGLALSVIWLGEPLHWGQLWGSLAIIAGLMVGLRRNGQNQVQPALSQERPAGGS